MNIRPILMFLSTVCFAATHAFAQADFPPGADGPPSFSPGGGRPPGGPPGAQPKLKLLKKFDQDGEKFLTGDEQKAALEYLNKERAEGRGRRGPGGMRGPGFGPQRDEEPPQPGK